MAGIQRGTMSVRMEYDQTGRITSQIFADGKSWTYTYLEKVRNVFCCNEGKLTYWVEAS